MIKIEHPSNGDFSLLRAAQDGVPLGWKVLARNKKSVTLDLSKPKGQELFGRLVAEADVVIMSFRPPTLER